MELTPSGIDSFRSKNGEVTGVLQGITLHSRFDPSREAEQIVKQSIPKDVSDVVVLGFGLGYHIDALVKFFPSLYLWVMEPDFSLFRACLELRDISSLLLNPRVRFFLGEEVSHKEVLLQNLEEVKATIFKFRPTFELHSSYFSSIEENFKRIQNRRQINLNTLARFGKLWVRNLSQNLPRFLQWGGIEPLEKRFCKLPALILAAGPSLDPVLPYLKKLWERFLIIAVDTSLAACLRTGVEPDFVVVMDPQYWNTRHLDRLSCKNTRLVSEPSTHPSIFRKIQTKTYLAGSIFPLGKYLEKHLGRRSALGAGGSVATSAWDLARFLGCNPLVLVGLDLSFPQKRTHFRGSFFEERVFSLCTRLKPEETFFFSYLQDGGPHWVPSNNGSKVLSDMRMKLYRDWFELQAKAYLEVKTLNLSAQGARIRGIETVEMDTLLQYPICRADLNKILNELKETQSTIPKIEDLERAVMN
ncbi:MAG: 6-hydroxymethylpterin diphosphokinase MptE-like protein, partial [Spirochaetales bacterium]